MNGEPYYSGYCECGGHDSDHSDQDDSCNHCDNCTRFTPKREKKIMVTTDSKKEMIEYLNSIAKQLITWANQSQNGGWSTHQVGPQQKLALEILSKVDRWER